MNIYNYTVSLLNKVRNDVKYQLRILYALVFLIISTLFYIGGKGLSKYYNTKKTDTLVLDMLEIAKIKDTKLKIESLEKLTNKQKNNQLAFVLFELSNLYFEEKDYTNAEKNLLRITKLCCAHKELKETATYKLTSLLLFLGKEEDLNKLIKMTNNICKKHKYYELIIFQRIVAFKYLNKTQKAEKEMKKLKAIKNKVSSEQEILHLEQFLQK